MSAATEAAVKFKIVVLNRLVALLWTTMRDLHSIALELENTQPELQVFDSLFKILILFPCGSAKTFS